MGRDPWRDQMPGPSEEVGAPKEGRLSWTALPSPPGCKSRYQLRSDLWLPAAARPQGPGRPGHRAVSGPQAPLPSLPDLRAPRESRKVMALSVP